MISERQAVEVFHLHFVRLLMAGRDKGGLIVKGGCNLRFFFGSIRYSEDLDLDVRHVSEDALDTRVKSVLDSRVLEESLQSAGLAVVRTSAPKQTPTTQRWKLAIRLRGSDREIGTKVEFSRREGSGEAALEAIDSRLLGQYQLMPVLATHYLLPAAIRQKVGALVGRREVQARDVFDLSLLFSKASHQLREFSDLRPQVPAAIERVWSLTYSDFQGQVAAFFEPEHGDAVASAPAWEAMQLHVVEALEAIGARS